MEGGSNSSINRTRLAALVLPVLIFWTRLTLSSPAFLPSFFVSRASQEEKDNSDIYDTVDEDEYSNLVRDRLAQDDFIEEDAEGSGYVDDGREDAWGRRDEDDDEASDDEDPEERRRRRGQSQRSGGAHEESTPDGWRRSSSAMAHKLSFTASYTNA
jgi:hypothetical protein